MIEKFLQLYPAWPQSLAESFRDLLAYAVAGSDAWRAAENFYRAETEKTYVTKYPSQVYGWNQQFQADVMKPTNQQFTVTVNTEKPYTEYPINAAVQVNRDYLIALGLPPNDWGVAPSGNVQDFMFYGNVSGRFRPYILTRYDSRLFSAVTSFLNWKFFPNGGTVRISDWLTGTITAASGSTELLMSAKGTPRKFTGIDSIIALHENGSTLPDVQIQKLYEFRTYVNAYTKFSAQVEAEIKSIAYAAESEIINYQATLAQDLATEKRALDNLALDLQNQMQVEAAAVQRDLTNTLLTAQTLAAQLSSGFR